MVGTSKLFCCGCCLGWLAGWWPWPGYDAPEVASLLPHAIDSHSREQGRGDTGTLLVPVQVPIVIVHGWRQNSPSRQSCPSVDSPPKRESKQMVRATEQPFREEWNAAVSGRALFTVAFHWKLFGWESPPDEQSVLLNKMCSRPASWLRQFGCIIIIIFLHTHTLSNPLNSIVFAYYWNFNKGT